MAAPATATAEVPTVDFGPFLKEEGVVIGDPPTEAQLEIAHQIDASCRGAAFLHLTNFGVSKELRDAAFACSAELFALTDKEEKLRRIDPSTNMGYSPFLSENVNRARPSPERKEAFNVRFPPTNENDFTGCPSGFPNMVEELQAVLRTAARRYAVACAVALGLPSQSFVESLQDLDLCTVRFLHYPAYDEYVTDDDRHDDPPVRIGEHTDFGAFTFLLLGENGAEGLQIKPVAGGETQETDDDGWRNVVVPPTDNGVVGAIVNTGALMARWTNDEWCATAHRVLIQNEVQASRSRYSIAFFVDPDTHFIVRVHEKFTKSGGGTRYAPISGSDYLLSKLQQMMGLS